MASRPLLGRDGQDSEGTEENQVNSTDSTVHETSDHEDSRRLASGLPADLSGSLGTQTQGSYLRTDRSDLGRQTDPGDRRTSNWRSSTPGSDVTSPSTGKPMWVSPTLDASRILMTGLRHHRDVSTLGSADNDREKRSTTTPKVAVGQADTRGVPPQRATS